MKRKFTLLMTALMLLVTNAFTAFGQTQYQKVTSAPDNWSGEYLLVWEKSADSAFIWNGVDAVNGYSYAPIASNKISTSTAVTITLDSIAGGYSVKINGGTNDGKFISHNANSNGLVIGTTAAKQVMSYSDGCVFMTNAGGAVMRFNKTSNQLRFRFYKTTSYSSQQPVQLYKKLGGGNNVATPTFTPAGGTYTTAQNVTIATKTSGATIYYTTDGTTPTTASSMYSTPISVSTTTTIKAMGVKTGMTNSSVASATYTFPTTYANIAAWKAAYTATSSEVATITGDVTVIYQNGKNLYVQDATGAMLVYGTLTNTYSNGDVISGGLTGTATKYSGYMEFIPTQQPAAGTAGTAIEPVTATVADYLADFDNYEFKLVKFVGGHFNATYTFSSSNKSTTYTQGESTVTVYNNYKTLTCSVSANQVADVTGIAIRFNTTKQIAPRTNNDIATQLETVKTPTFTPAEGTYISEQAVTIACETEGATVRYTIDGTDPTEASSEYTGAIAIAATTTVKAKAWKTGLEASAIASATYTIPSVITIAEARALDANQYALVEGIVTFIDGTNVYAEDETAGIVLYLNSNTVPETLAAGDIVRAYGKKTTYKGLVELKSIDGSDVNAFKTISTGNPLPLTVKTIAEINAGATGNMQSTRVKIEDAEIGTINTSGNTTLTQGENTINIYKIPALTGIQEGDFVNVISVISYFNNVQLRVASANDVIRANSVEMPTFTPASASFLVNQDITISCETEGASIYYTTDGTTPTTSSTLYTEPFTLAETTTVKAVAAKTGMNISNISEATYTKLTVNTIAEARTLGIDEYAAVEGIVTFIDGRNIYVQDATAGIVLFLNTNTVPSTLAIGDNVRAYGKKTVYKGLVELSGIDGGNSNHFAVISSGNPLPEAVVKTIAEVSEDFDSSNMLQSTRIQIVKAKIGAINTSGNTPIRQNGSTMNIYKIPMVEGMIQGDFVTVTGIVGCMNVPQLRVSESSDIEYTHAPTLTAEPASLTGLNYNIEEGGPSEIKTFALSGDYLKSTIFIYPSENFEISLTDGEYFYPENEIGLNPGSSLSNYNIYVRLKAGLPLGTYDESIVCAAIDADTLHVAVNGQVREIQTPSDYARITNIAQLTNGAKVIFAARYNTTADSYYAMTAVTTGKPTGVLFTSATGQTESLPSTIADEEASYYWTVGINGSNYTFTNANGDVLGYSSGTNFATGGDNVNWTIEYGTSDTAAMVASYNAFVITNGNLAGRAFALNTSHNFGPYAKSNMTGNNAANYNFYLDMFATAGGTPVCATPSIAPASGTYYEAQSVTITCGTEDATIYYTTDGTEPTSESTVYVSPLTVTEDMTIKAIAMKEGYDDSSVATAEYTIILGATTIFSQDWEGDMNGWTFVTVEGSKPWMVALNNLNHYAYANGYNGGANEQWCISPAFNLDIYSDVTLSFLNAKNFTGPDMQVFFTNNYDGINPATATWTELTYEKSTGSWAWTESGAIALDGFSGTNCHIGYKYTSTETEAAGWRLDDIIMVGFTSATTLNINPTALNGFSYINGYGPSTQQSFNITGANLTSNVTLTMAGTDFEMSVVGGEGFTAQSTITLTPALGAINQNIYVRLAADLDVDDYASSITVDSELDDITVTLSGSVEEEGDSWNRIMSASDIVDGASVIIAARYNEVSNEYYAMTASTSGKPEGVLFTSVMEGSNETLPIDIVMNESTYRWTVNVDNGVYTFTNAAGDMIGYGGSGTNFQSNGDNTTWTIDYILSSPESMVPDYYGFLITNTTSSTRAFAINSTYHSYGPYSTQNLTGGNASGYNFCVDIFVQGGEVTQTVMTPVITPASGTYYEDIDVTIACATEGAVVHYTTDGSTPTAASPVYTEAIHVSEDMTIKAIGIKEGYVDSNVATAEYVIMNDINIIFAQDWEGDMNGWKFETIEGNKPWAIDSYNNNHFAKVNGYGDDTDNEQWCISPAFNLTQLAGSNITLNFINATKFDGPALELLFSNDYDGQDILNATWQPLTYNMSAGNYEWTPSGDVSLNGLTGTYCTIAFKYTSTVDMAAAWEIDDIILYTDGQAPAQFITSTNNLSGFTYVYGNGPSQVMSFTLSAYGLSGAPDYASVYTEGQYMISTDGETWEDEILLYYENGQLVNQPYTIYVRMNSGLEINTYLGGVIAMGGGASHEVVLHGEVTPTTGIAESMEENISIYSCNHAIIIKNDSKDNLTMWMFNILGQPLMNKTITTGDNVINHGLPTGAYIIRLNNGSSVMTRKIVLR